MNASQGADPEPCGAAPVKPSPELAHAAFGELIPDLAEQAALFRSDTDVTDQELLEIFADEIRKVEQGMGPAINGQDVATLREHAHTLQGMGGAVGAPEISAVGAAFSKAAQSGDFRRCQNIFEAFCVWHKAWMSSARA